MATATRLVGAVTVVRRDAVDGPTGGLVAYAIEGARGSVYSLWRYPNGTSSAWRMSRVGRLSTPTAKQRQAMLAAVADYDSNAGEG